jgi:hypothetical protein
MNCRHISEDDIRSVLKRTINDNKSDLNSKPDPKYALEGKPRSTVCGDLRTYQPWNGGDYLY